ncbi:UDP-N-acetylmuramoyl-L-alanine--D-glutamate ligase [Vibrio sp. JPW-9-11-11]|uniref:UDP-N-acetylmuramoyl-L-alanine--D-glutamate ligase n=1 Tax=Vibrio sp. JPW-9-11-11 TaxID=1416532 RepID=UPI001594B227|nr:UDP-N-acetylmuramoyl-L-alanine--D-glutamate ligase [Vibrio sp. JPW-9-11-11]NVD07406.1 UDP-N-acetylmuramoyl-L-alanine--D-glutamate ligase [Vibrio sp. JPW-9-11-11]
MATARWQGIDKVVVVGLGMTGLSVVKHIAQLPHRIQIQVIDTRAEPPGREQLPTDVELHSGSWRMDWLLNADLVVANPGIALATDQIQQVLQAGIPVVGDIELFAWQVDKPVIAITGSNGKSTVTDWTGQVAKASGVKVAVGGNIGVPALDLLTQDADLYVLELSSFQLETTSSLTPVAAAFLNLSEDHMDRYQGMDDYRQAKLRIFNHAQACIVNADDKQTYPQGDKKLVEFSLTQHCQYHLASQSGIEYLFKGQQPICATEALSLVGRHNVANALVVVALLTEAGIEIDKGLSALKSYNGLTHRCQVVVDNQGVKWVNDSKATNVASTMAALAGLELAGKLYLLVGGVGKGADFSQLGPVLAPLDVQLCCFGQDAEQFMTLHPSARRFDTMHEIIQWLAPRVQSGDMVLLSPACASFDQFDHFMARGDAFTQLAQTYA